MLNRCQCGPYLRCRYECAIFLQIASLTVGSKAQAQTLADTKKALSDSKAADALKLISALADLKKRMTHVFSNCIKSRALFWITVQLMMFVCVYIVLQNLICW